MSGLSDQQVTIVGLGLMGASLAIALQDSGALLTAVDKDANALQKGLSAGIVHQTTRSLVEGASEADFVILAIPVRGIIQILEELAIIRPRGIRVMDLGSSKQAIHVAMNNLPVGFEAIGGHPMCGKEVQGLDNASGDLYKDKTFALCRNDHTTLDVEELALDIIEVIGARPLFVQAKLHDMLVAATSHLPFVLSSLLIRQAWSIGESEELMWRLTASGFRDSTRLAASSPAMMLDILMTNNRQIIRQLQEFGKGMEELITLLSHGEEDMLKEWLVNTGQLFQTIRRQTTDGD